MWKTKTTLNTPVNIGYVAKTSGRPTRNFFEEIRFKTSNATTLPTA